MQHGGKRGVVAVPLHWIYYRGWDDREGTSATRSTSRDGRRGKARVPQLTLKEEGAVRERIIPLFPSLEMDPVALVPPLSPHPMK